MIIVSYLPLYESSNGPLHHPVSRTLLLRSLIKMYVCERKKNNEEHSQIKISAYCYK
jgi:hypothetical protein